MRHRSVLVSAVASGVVGAAAVFATPGVAAIDNTKDCKVVELKPGESPPPNTMSSTVTAGNGQVSGSATGGQSVTVHSGGGTASSSVTTGAASGAGGSTIVTSSDGGCTRYVTPKAKE